VQQGSFVKECNIQAIPYYPLQQTLTLEKNSAIFVEFVAKPGQSVKKGDILARFTADASSVTLERLVREIALLEEETALGVSQRSEAIETLKNTQAEGLEKEKIEILLKKQQAELQHYQYLQQRSVDALKQEKKTEQEKLNGYILTAPEDGKVFDFANIQAGDPVTAGQTLMTFVQTDVVQLQVRNSAGELRYNMPVKVTVGRRNAQTVLAGRIVAADGAIPQKERTGFAYISVETDKEMIDPKITAETVRLDNVLVVARNAVVMENGKYYVTKLADGMLQKRCIGFGMNSTSDAWIIHGVVSGDTLIAD
jgi:multidrug resistance efflux pump